jgi:hypothetical protein
VLHLVLVRMPRSADAEEEPARNARTPESVTAGE